MLRKVSYNSKKFKAMGDSYDSRIVEHDPSMEIA